MKRFAVIPVFVLATAMFVVGAGAGASTKAPVPSGPLPVAFLEGGRRVDFVRAVFSEQQLHEKRSFLNKIVDFVAGAPNWHKMVRPYSVVTDSHGRMLVTDPGARTIHIFDFEKKKYTAIEGGKRDSFKSPIGIAVDAEDNIYVTDSQVGKIFVFDARGKFRRMLGDVKGEGFYKRPTGLACDKAAGLLYVTDTLRDRVYVTDLNGTVLRYFGKRGLGSGEFNLPTEVVVRGDKVYVVDAMNFRVQVFDKSGAFVAQFGSVGSQPGQLFRPKGLALDSQNHFYLVDAAMEAVQVFNPGGQLLYTFGRTGQGISEFELPSGVWIDGNDRIFVADSYNHRVQVFQFVSGEKANGGRD